MSRHKKRISSQTGDPWENFPRFCWSFTKKINKTNRNVTRTSFWSLQVSNVWESHSIFSSFLNPKENSTSPSWGNSKIGCSVILMLPNTSCPLYSKVRANLAGCCNSPDFTRVKRKKTLCFQTRLCVHSVYFSTFLSGRRQSSSNWRSL